MKKRMMIILGIVVTAIILAVIGKLVLDNKPESYREVSVAENTGENVVYRDTKDTQLDVYEGMHLMNGDKVAVNGAGTLIMKLDDDKYLAADENTKFYLEAEGKDNENGKTVIVLEEGTLMFLVGEKLGNQESFEIHTPDAVMSIRGTTGLVWTGTSVSVLDANIVLGSSNDISDLEMDTHQSGFLLLEGSLDLGVTRASDTANSTLNSAMELHVEGPSLVVTTLDDDNVVFKPQGQEKLNAAINQHLEFINNNAKVISDLISDLISESDRRSQEKLDILNEILTDIRISNSSACITNHLNKNTRAVQKDFDFYVEEYCKDCGTIFSSNLHQCEDYLANFGVTKKPTCLISGEQTSVCSLCQKAYIEEVPATGHTPGEWVITKEATCTALGERSQACTVCQEVLQTEEIPATGQHTLGEWVITKEATCTTAGERSLACTVCQEVLQTEEIPSTGHTLNDWITITEPTCTTPGTKQRNCTTEGCEYIEKESIAATGHVAGEWITETTATCTSEGLKVQYCTICQQELSREVQPMTNHILGAWHTLWSPSCTTNGLEECSCEVCGTTFTQGTPALGHRYTEWQHFDPTCTIDGCDFSFCTRCEITREKNIVAALGHSFSTEGEYIEGVDNEPDCYYHYCTREGCDEYIVEPILID